MWADYSEPEWGLTVQVADPDASAPWAMIVDARKGALSVLPHPPSEPTTDARAYATREFRFRLTLHESSWPATYPCERSYGAYTRLLDLLNQPDSRWTPLNVVMNWGLGDGIPDGTRTPEEMRDVYHRVIVKERVQPSVLLRLLYRGDGWIMQGLAKQVLGRTVPRNQPLEAWDELARQLLQSLEADAPPAGP